MKYALGDKRPTLSDNCYIAPSADVIGDVVMHDNSSVWFNCVLRADNDTITVGKGSNVQDGAVLHVDEGYPLDIGENVTIGHKVMLHGCTIGDNSLIGMNAVVLNGAKIGNNCIIGAGALVTEKTEIPDGYMALGAPATPVKELGEKVIKMLQMGADHYMSKSEQYKKELKVID